jgi:phosphoadenosine phosphosulfate reductase
MTPDQINQWNAELRGKSPLEITRWAVAEADGRTLIRPYLPRLTAAHRDAVYGPIPELDDEAGLKEFSALMKLEPFQRGIRELAPKVWITGLRKVQNPNRAELDIVSLDGNFGTLKVSPVFRLSDAEMEAYLAEHNLPNEWDYFDPAKADEKRECGLHAAWGGEAVKG